jgi:hypothetical protein
VCDRLRELRVYEDYGRELRQHERLLYAFLSCHGLAGDLDFLPIVEALVQRGVFVDVWFDRKSAAKELYDAADFWREIPFSELHSRSRGAVLGKYPLPQRFTGAGMSQRQPIKRGKFAASPAFLYQFDSGYQL